MRAVRPACQELLGFHANGVAWGEEDGVHGSPVLRVWHIQVFGGLLLSPTCPYPVWRETLFIRMAGPKVEELLGTPSPPENKGLRAFENYH